MNFIYYSAMVFIALLYVLAVFTACFNPDGKYRNGRH